MQLPQCRFTVRRLMLITAGLALGLFIASECWDGMPPRFVLRGIPARIDRLRPGMTWEQAREIIGLETSWIEGGTSARFHGSERMGNLAHETYYLRPPRLVAGMAPESGSPAMPAFYQSGAMIQLWFTTDGGAGILEWRGDKATRLTGASFSSDSRVVSKMPGSR
jgi:hypothetical protein